LPAGTTGVLLTFRVVSQMPGAKPRDPYQQAVISAYGTAEYLSDILRRASPMGATDYDALLGVLWPEPGYGIDHQENIRSAWRGWARFSLQEPWGRGRELSASDASAILTSYRAELADALAPAPLHPSALTRVRTPPRPWERRLWIDYHRRVGMDREDGGDENSAITESVALSMALRIAPRYMPEGGRAVLRAVVDDPVFHAATVLAISAYLALWLAPEPVFSKAAAVFTTVGLVATVGVSAAEIMALARAWNTLREDCAGARHIDDLDAAAARFGRTVGAAGAKILLGLATMVGVKALGMTGKTIGGAMGGGAASTGIVSGWSARGSAAVLHIAPVAIRVDRASGQLVMIPGAVAMAALKADSGAAATRGSVTFTLR